MKMDKLELMAIDLIDMGLTNKEDIKQVIKLSDVDMEALINIIKSK